MYYACTVSLHAFHRRLGDYATISNARFPTGGLISKGASAMMRCCGRHFLLAHSFKTISFQFLKYCYSVVENVRPS